MVLEYKLPSSGLGKFNSQSGKVNLSTNASKVNFSPFSFFSLLFKEMKILHSETVIHSK